MDFPIMFLVPLVVFGLLVFVGIMNTLDPSVFAGLVPDYFSEHFSDVQTVVMAVGFGIFALVGVSVWGM
jgi:hypothetical protein